MKSYIFKVAVEEDEFEDGTKAYHASCLALKGCHTWGHTYQEALANIREAVELYVDDLEEITDRDVQSHRLTTEKTGDIAGKRPRTLPL